MAGSSTHPTAVITNSLTHLTSLLTHPLQLANQNPHVLTHACPSVCVLCVCLCVCVCVCVCACVCVCVRTHVCFLCCRHQRVCLLAVHVPGRMCEPAGQLRVCVPR